MSNTRFIALYLPQFHPIKENDDFWGKGFTEWRNVSKALPLFKEHYQPRLPADLGFYDLRLEETREEQAELAKKYGIEGFCYWHYWFGNGKMVLEKPLEWVLESKKPNYPFCMGWANHSWSNKTWEKTGLFKETKVFLEQTYPGEEDLIDHFNYLLPFFLDDRYIKVDEKPLFLIFNPSEIPDNEKMIKLWNELAKNNGLKGIHFIARLDASLPRDSKRDIAKGEKKHKRFESFLKMGYDAVYSVPVQLMRTMDNPVSSNNIGRLINKTRRVIKIEKHDYKKLIPYMFSEDDKNEKIYPQIMPHWDNTPRQGKNGYVFTNEDPQLFYNVAKKAIECVKEKKEDHRIVFVHSWNEWGEGAYMEPDLKYGLRYLEALKSAIDEQ